MNQLQVMEHGGNSECPLAGFVRWCDERNDDSLRDPNSECGDGDGASVGWWRRLFSASRRGMTERRDSWPPHALTSSCAPAPGTLSQPESVRI